MTYSIIPKSDWQRLRRLFAKYDQPTPDPDTSMVAIAEDEQGNIKGCLVLQLAMHMEPLIIRDSRVNFLSLQRELEQALTSSLPEGHVVEYFAFSHTDKVSRMAEIAGMQPTEYKVWRKGVA